MVLFGIIFEIFPYHFTTRLVDCLQHTPISSITKLFRYLIPIHFGIRFFLNAIISIVGVSLNIHVAMELYNKLVITLFTHPKSM